MEAKRVGLFKIVGIAVRTTNEVEESRASKVEELWQRILSENLYERIKGICDKNKLYAVYSDYDGDAYTVTIGYEVESFCEIPLGLIGKTIHSASYTLVKASDNTKEGSLELAQKAWSLAKKDTDIQKKRRLGTDFAVYRLNEDDQHIELYINVAS